MRLIVMQHAEQRYELRAGRPAGELRRRICRALRCRTWPMMRGRRGRIHLPLGRVEAVLQAIPAGWVVMTVLVEGGGEDDMQKAERAEVHDHHQRICARVDPYVKRLRAGEKNPWLVYTVAKIMFDHGLWRGLTRAGMRRILGRMIEGADPGTVAQGWTQFLDAHRNRLPQ